VAKWASYAAPSRWAYEANLLNEKKNQPTYTIAPDPIPYDYARSSIPHYVDGKKIAGPDKGKNNRHTLNQCILILTAMLLTLVSGVLVSLRLRDIQ
jgi:hypothetical protein